MKERNDISNTEILLSIVIPVYNVADYLEQCLDSLIKQDISLHDYEIILVDDGSTDGSSLIYAEYAKKYPNILVTKQKNSGQSVARNTGLQNASGKYIWFVDADDYIKSCTIASALERMEKENLDLLFFDAEVEFENKEFNTKNRYDRKGLIAENKVVSGQAFFEISRKKDCAIVSPCLVLFSKKYLDATNVLFLPGRIYEDNLFFFSTIMRAERVMYLAEKMYVRRYRDDSTMTKTLVAKNVDDMICVVSEIIKEVVKLYATLSYHLKNELMVYISDLIRYTLQMCTDAKIDKEERAKSKTQTYSLFLNAYIKLIDQKTETITDIKNMLLILSHIQLSELDKEHRKKILQEAFGEQYSSVYMAKLSYEEKLRNKYIEFFISHKFGDKICTIGIYGKGVHTKNMLQICRLYLGKIEANIVYIDSDISVKTERKENVIHVSEALGRVDEILISSFTYEEEMYEMALNTLKDAIPIHRIYLQEARSIF